MDFNSIVDDLPLAVGLQLRNVALSRTMKILPQGSGALNDAREILGDHLDEWL